MTTPVTNPVGCVSDQPTLCKWEGAVPAMLPLESCFMMSGFRLSFGPVDTGREVAGILSSSRTGLCLLATIREAVRPRLIGIMLRRRAERAMRSVAILSIGRVGVGQAYESTV